MYARYGLLAIMLCNFFVAHAQLTEQLHFQRGWQEGNKLTDEQQAKITALESQYPEANEVSINTTQLPLLLRHHPALRHTIPYVSLCALPTPVKFCSQLSAHHGVQLWTKLDGLSGGRTENGEPLYGGNKPRKLEFLLGDALARGYKDVLTFGCIGSKHAVATTVHARRLGLTPHCMLKFQPLSESVRELLLLQLRYEAHLYHDTNNAERMEHTLAVCQQIAQRTGKLPYIIPTGGSNALGALGFVNAIYELYEQIQRGVMPMPSVIYGPMGSAGTAAGMLLGLTLLQLPIRLELVGVEPVGSSWPQEFEERIRHLFHAANELLHAADATIPVYEFPVATIHIDYDFTGPDYGVFTHEGITAVKSFAQEEIHLDGVYTGKVAAGLLANLSKWHGQTVLFWDTYCGEDFSAVTSAVHWQNLPRVFHPYFDGSIPVQQLD